MDPGAYEAVQFKPNADGHIFLLHTEEIEPLAQPAGLCVEKIALFTNPLTAGHMKAETLLKILPRGVVELMERASQHLPAALKEKAPVQMAVRFRKSSCSAIS